MGDPVANVGTKGCCIRSLCFSANLEMPYMPFILDGISVKGSLVATRAVHREMLAFAAFHGIKPVVETLPLTAEGMKEAMDKLDGGKIHFKAVLVAKEELGLKMGMGNRGGIIAGEFWGRVVGEEFRWCWLLMIESN
jgi:hypothetical protein